MPRKKAEQRRANQSQLLRRSRKQVATAEDWSPSYYSDSGAFLVATTNLWKYSASDAKRFLGIQDDLVFRFHVSFWGADDTGMDLEQLFSDLGSASRTYDNWQSWLSRLGLVSRRGLYNLGFKSV